MYCLRKPFAINLIWPRASGFSQHLANNSAFPVVNCTCWDIYSFGIHYYVGVSFNSCLPLLLLGMNHLFSIWMMYKLSKERDAAALRSEMESPWHECYPSPGHISGSHWNALPWYWTWAKESFFKKRDLGWFYPLISDGTQGIDNTTVFKTYYL